MLANPLRRRTTLGIIALSCLLVVGCGGGESPADDEPGDSLGFANPATEIVALIARSKASEPNLVVMKPTDAGAVDGLVAAMESGLTGVLGVDVDGRLSMFISSGETFELGNYGIGTVTLTHRVGGMAPVVEILSIDTTLGAPRATPPTADASLKDQIAWALGWAMQAGTHDLLAAIAARADDPSVGLLLEMIQTRAIDLLATQGVPAVVVHNALTCGMPVRDRCALLADAMLDDLLDGLKQVDPGATTTATLQVVNGGIAPVRTEWDPLIAAGAINTNLQSCDQAIFSQIDPLCPDYVAPLTIGPRPNLYGDTFVVDGISYSPSPVLNSHIKGFAYDIATGSGVSDGESGGSHVWYGNNSCLSFRIDGTGTQDQKGGRNASFYSFPLVSLEWKPGTVQARLMGGPNASQIVDPTYDRRSELHNFRWGVRLNANGTVYEDGDGYYQVYVQFLDGSPPLRGAWDPVTQKPATDLYIGGLADMYSNTLADLSTDLPASQHFCMFREQTSISLPSLGTGRCITTLDTGTASPYLNRTYCYSSGMIQGEYSAVDVNGTLRESGEYFANKKAGGWTFWNPDGTTLASGSYDDVGLQTGEWTYHDYAGALSEIVNFRGSLEASSHGTYYVLLDGSYKKYNTFTGLLAESGRLVLGEKDGWWKDFDSEIEYDATILLPAGTQCYTTSAGTDCTPYYDSWLKTRKNYDFDCHSVLTVTSYTTGGDFNGQVCYRIDGTPDSYTIGETVTCPSVSCR